MIANFLRAAPGRAQARGRADRVGAASHCDDSAAHDLRTARDSAPIEPNRPAPAGPRRVVASTADEPGGAGRRPAATLAQIGRQSVAETEWIADGVAYLRFNQTARAITQSHKRTSISAFDGAESAFFLR